jgi:hypothetical protein
VVIQEETVEKMDTSIITDGTVVFIILNSAVGMDAQQSFAWSVSTGCFCGWKPVAGASMILENAGAELRLFNGTIPDWKHLILNPAERAPDFFFACPKGAFDVLVPYVKRNPKIGY